MTIADNETAEPSVREDDCGCGSASPGTRTASDPLVVPSHEHTGGASARNAGPPSFTRNAFFPRKLMEVRHWQAEQDYHRGTRELLTRLATGCGVLCGLEVVAAEDGTVVITAGVAVDGRGREIVVPHDIVVDPAQLTDACGRPAGDRLADGAVTLSLCYHECGADPVALPPDGCDDERRCVPSMIRESFAVTVARGAVERVDCGLCDALWPGGEAGPDSPPASRDERRARLDAAAPRGCGCGRDGECVPLAVVTLRGKDGVVVDQGVRTVVRSNTELLELILCLADRIDECCARTHTAAPPSITDMFPWPGADPAAVVTEFARAGVVEIAFDAAMDQADLDTPGSWLGMWVIGAEAAARVELVRDATASPARVAVPPGGSAAVFRLGADRPDAADHAMEMAAVRMVKEPVAIVAMVLSGSTGVIRADDAEHAALDADRTATLLSAAQRAELWAIAPGAAAGFTGAAQAVPTAGIPLLPTGNGAAGGELHIALSIARKPEPEPEPDPEPEPNKGVAPHLEAVAPSAVSARVRRGQPFPSLDVTLSAPVADAALGDPRAWLRAWEGSLDNGMFGISEIALDQGAAEPQAGGTVLCRFPVKLSGAGGSNRIVVAVLWPDAAPVGSAPLGLDAATTLLDADWIATTFDEDTLRRLWGGDDFRDGLPDPRPAAVPKPPLWDGNPGGLVHWAFLVQGD